MCYDYEEHGVTQDENLSDRVVIQYKSKGYDVRRGDAGARSASKTRVREASDDEMSDGGPPAIAPVPRGGYPSPPAAPARPPGGLHAQPSRGDKGAARVKSVPATSVSGSGDDDLLAERLADIALDDARAARPGDKARAASRAAARREQHRQALVPKGSADSEGWRCFHTTDAGTRCSRDRTKAAFKFCTQHTNQHLDAGASNEEMKFRV